MPKININKKNITSIFLSIILLVLIVISLYPSRSLLTMDFATPSRGDTHENACEIFYQNGTGWASVTRPLQSVETNLSSSTLSAVMIPLPLEDIQELRIDPGTMPNVWKIEKITLQGRIAGRVLYSHVWLPDDIVRDFQPLNSIDTFSVRDKVLFLNASGVDPFFGYKGNFSGIYKPLLKKMSHFKSRVYIAIAVAALFLILLNWKTVFTLFLNQFNLMKRPLTLSPGSPFIFPGWFWGLLGISTFIKVWLVSGQTFPAIFAPHDDLLYLSTAQKIACGRWLGEYTTFTLLKQPFYPFWIACMFWLGVPLSLSQHLFYAGSCLLFVIAIRPLLRNIPLLLFVVYAVLLFHPISYAGNQMARVVREGVYLSLPLLVLSFAIGLLLRKDTPIKNFVRWNIGLGISFAIFWLTREEGALLLPPLFILLVTLLVSIVMFSQEKKKRLKACCIPLALAFAVIGAVAGMNKIYYGMFTTCEQVQRDYTDAYGAMLRVKPKVFQRYLLIPHEMRERIYAVSPAFAKLQPFLDGDVLNGWAHWGPYAEKEISTHFMFAFRDAVALAGYYRSADIACGYYRRLASEINAVCDAGKLECYKKDNSFMPKSAYRAAWRNEDLNLLISTCADLAVSMTKLSEISMTPRLESDAPEEVQRFYQDMTRDRISPTRQNPLPLPRQQKVDAVKTRVLEGLFFLYRCFTPTLVVLGLAAYFFHVILIFIRRRADLSFLIITALLLAASSRIFMLSLVQVTLDPNFTHIILYKSSAFPLLAAFPLLSIITLFLGSFKERMSLQSKNTF